MTLYIYPDDPKPASSYILDHQFRTILSNFEWGTESSRRRWRFPKRSFSLIYNVMDLSANQRGVLYEFFKKRYGSYESFWYFDFQERKWVDQLIGYGDGSEMTFDLPSSNTTDYIVYLDGVENRDFNFSSGTGEGGADQITFTVSAPGDGVLITGDFTANLRIKARFVEDKLSEEMFTKDLINLVLRVQEVKN